ncbi:MAG: hypothetical protein A3K30_03915 [Deltaproteobacteria bacterium RBG_13_51_10]|nr:MAG: hypothetical protein A3K30_03915 [Deltaproteobacteria bacterium RBG_13_51_10]
MTTGFDEIIDRLRSFQKKVHTRLQRIHNSELMHLIDALQGFSHKVANDLDRTSMKSCLEAVGRLKSFRPHRLGTQEMAAYLDLGWDKTEIATLYSLSSTQMYTKHQATMRDAKDGKFEKKLIGGGPEGGPVLPDYLKEKKPEELTDEDTYVIARIQMVHASLNGNLEASQKLLNQFKGFMQSDLKVKWEQVKILDNFFLSQFLPNIQKHIKINDPLPRILAELNEIEANNGFCAGESLQRIREICWKGRIDAKTLFRDTLKEVAPEIREVATRALETASGRVPAPQAMTMPQPRMDEAVSKAKHRGKWKKKTGLIKGLQKEKEPTGVMELQEPTPLEEERGSTEISGAETKAGLEW